MRIYLIRRVESPGPSDEADGFVVAAPNAVTARDLCSKQAGDEGPLTWNDASQTSCVTIGYGNFKKAHVIMRSFSAA